MRIDVIVKSVLTVVAPPPPVILDNTCFMMDIDDTNTRFLPLVGSRLHLTSVHPPLHHLLNPLHDNSTITRIIDVALMRITDIIIQKSKRRRGRRDICRINHEDDVVVVVDGSVGVKRRQVVVTLFLTLAQCLSRRLGT